VYSYKGQEKVQIKSGEFQGVCGHVRKVYPTGYLYLILDNSQKVSLHKNNVKYLHHNYFLVGAEQYIKSKKQQKAL